LALTSDLFAVLLPLLHGTKSDFLDFLGKAIPAEGQNCYIARIFRDDCSEKQFKIPQLLRGTSGVQPPKTVQEACTNEDTSPGPDGVRHLKVTKVERWQKRNSFSCALIFKPSRLLAKGKLMSLTKAFCLSRGNITFSGI
jgi:hypothetical protein